MDRSAPASTYLTVKPSPLVPSLLTGATFFRPSENITLNMAASHDPDIVATNTSGIRLEVFCYPVSANNVYKQLNADQLRSTATSVVNNRCAPMVLWR